jgi:micrococcal nuclease
VKGLIGLVLATLCWTGAATMIRTIDGDTFDAMVQAYPKMIVTERIRVLGVNTPEMHAPTLDAGKASKAFSEAWLARGAVTLAIGCSGQSAYDSFGRALAVVTRGETNLADDLIAAGLGVPMAGR